MKNNKSRSGGQTKIYEMVTSRIIEELEQSQIPWKQPWISGWPKNFITQKPYRGLNPLLLLCTDYSSPYWLTFNQAKKLKGGIRRGEKGCPVIFWKWIEVENKEKSEEKKQIPLLKYYTVFNLDQTENIQQSSEIKPLENLEAPETVVKNMPNKPAITHREARAYYRPKPDVVNLPNRSLFSSIEDYYCTLFHELTHSTGHQTRLNRKEVIEKIQFNSEDYSKEELVAEIGATFLCASSGIHPQIIENSTAYIQGWLKKLRDDKKIIVTAAAKAQKAADYILGTAFLQ